MTVRKFRMTVRKFRMTVRKFCMTVRKFRMVMQNHFSHFPCMLQPTPILFHFAWSCEIEKHVFPTPPCNFSHFFIFNPSPSSQLSSKSQSKPIALFLSLCIWIIINFICFLQFDSSLLTQIYQYHTLKWLQNFIKLVNNSYKGKNMLIECFKHNYYPKDVKLMRIII